MKKRTLNLLPPAEVQPMSGRKAAAIVALAAALYIAVMGSVLLANSYELDRLNSAIEDLTARKLQMKQHLGGTPGADAGLEDAAKAEIMNAMRSTPPWDAILSELSLVVPETIWLEVIEAGDGRHLRLKGYSKSQADIARLIARLEGSDYFRNVEIVFSQMGEEVAVFELKADMIWT